MGGVWLRTTPARPRLPEACPPEGAQNLGHLVKACLSEGASAPELMPQARQQARASCSCTLVCDKA